MESAVVSCVFHAKSRDIGEDLVLARQLYLEIQQLELTLTILLDKFGRLRSCLSGC